MHSWQDRKPQEGTSSPSHCRVSCFRKLGNRTQNILKMRSARRQLQDCRATVWTKRCWAEVAMSGDLKPQWSKQTAMRQESSPRAHCASLERRLGPYREDLTRMTRKTTVLLLKRCGTQTSVRPRDLPIRAHSTVSRSSEIAGPYLLTL